LDAQCYAGLISGTSMDSVDLAVCEFAQTRFVRTLALRSRPYPAALRQRLLSLQRGTAPIPLAELAELDRAVGDEFAALLESAAAEFPLQAAGSHGQTVFHDPRGAGSSLQLGDPNRIAVRAGIPVVADFRRADIALGGEGAPLVPAFHHAVFAAADRVRCVVNIGGIGNLSLLDHGDLRRGFDTGPGNGLMDEWASQHLGQAYDADGAWGATGQVLPALLDALWADPYFHAPAPKSTGRDYFHLGWVRQRCPALDQFAPADVQRSLCALSVRSIAVAVQACAGVSELFVCGGGARNGLLMRELQTALPGITVQSTAALGLDPQAVEASAFAWLALRRLRNLPGNAPQVTGARRAAVLGALYAP
jgi:anhydro-N-acetylmuramic acid kinase